MTNGGEVYLKVLSTHTYSDFRTKPTTLIYPFPKQKKSGISHAAPVVNSSMGDVYRRPIRPYGEHQADRCSPNEWCSPNRLARTTPLVAFTKTLSVHPLLRCASYKKVRTLYLYSDGHPIETVTTFTD